jgi:IclR family pca regulon transcriptional regulator
MKQCSQSERKGRMKRSNERVGGERELVAGCIKGLNVIEAFGAAHPRLTLAEAAHKTGLTRAAARRYLLTLQKYGYVDSDGKFFRLTPRVLRLGYSYLASVPLPELAQPILNRISDRTREAASVAILDSHEIVFIARSAPQRIMTVRTTVGTRLPAYCTAMGRILLSNLSKPQLLNFFKYIKLQKLTPKTITDRTKLLAAIAQARNQGYAIVDEELEMGLRTIAAPLRDSRGAIAAAISISLQSARMTPAEMERDLLPILQESCQPLSAVL